MTEDDEAGRPADDAAGAAADAKKAPPPMREWERKRLVAFLKECILYRPLLNGFEADVVDGVTQAYRKFGTRCARPSEKQRAVLNRIADKLLLGDV